jgi:hypothetical protein
MVRPIVAELSGDGVQAIDGPTRRKADQLEGRAALRFAGGNDGTPDRTHVTWVVRAAPGTTVSVLVQHDRAGRASMTVSLAG